MALIAKESGGSANTFFNVPSGMHLARCYRIIDLGTQESNYQGKISFLPKVMLQFEVFGEDDEGKPLTTPKGEPLSVSKNFTLSLSEKATLRKDLQTWRGKEFTPEELRGFELKNVMGHWAMLSIVKAIGNNGKEYSNIQAILSVPPQIKKAGLPQGHNPVVIFSIDEPDMAIFETFRDGLKERIINSPEWKKRNGNSAPTQASSDKSSFDDMADDIPF
jgi:hypothetical protein